MARKEIRPSNEHHVCAICGRTLLRGEQVETFLSGGRRHVVCTLCEPRAVTEGWIREGGGDISAPPDDDLRPRLLERLRTRRVRPAEDEAGEEPPPFPQGDPFADLPRATPRTPPPRAYDPAAPTRQVHAVPTSNTQKAAAALDLFNGSEHPRTVAGVARSLGAPGVTVAPAPGHSSIVTVTAAWELCWYRWEVDLADPDHAVRLAAQGYELSELPPEELEANAAADDRGELALAGEASG